MPQSQYEAVRKLAKRVTSHGRYFSIKCPYHDDVNPSMLVYSDGFYCMGCRRRGTLTRLLSTLTGKSYSADSSKPPSPYYFPNYAHPEEIAARAFDTLMAFPNLSGWLESRHVDQRIEYNELGWFEGWYTIPLFGEKRNFQGLVMRAGPELQKRKDWRYMVSPGTEPNMYVPDWSLCRRAEKIIVVFGIFDALSLTSLRIPTVTSSHGKKFFPEWLDTFRKPIHILPDAGEEEEARILASNLGWRGKVVTVDYPRGCKDPNDLIVKNHTQYLLSKVA